MDSPSSDPNATRRRRALIVPREHGAWGLLLIPLFTGLIAGIGATGRMLPVLLFTLCGIALFWLRTPVESLLGSAPNAARTPQERRTAMLAAAILGTLSLACLGALLRGGRNLTLLLFGGIAAAAFVAQAVLRKMGRETRMISQLVGGLGLTATAPAAFYVATGRFDQRTLTLWLANWLFAWNQIHFVQVRIHAARALTFRDKFSRGKGFLIAQTMLAAALAVLAVLHFISPFVALAFLPVVARGTAWFAMNRSEPLDVKKLGWSEMRQGVAFGILLGIAFLAG